jgi:glycosyltransferase involved in cell wall biosynthesis
VPELRKHGFDPHVATLRHRGSNFEDLARQGITTRFVGMRSRADISGIARALGLSRLRPDLVLTSSVNAQAIGHLVALRARAPHVTIEHGGPGLPKAPHRRLLVRMVAPRVERVVAVSATQVEELRRVGYRSARIAVIPNGIPVPAPTRPREVVRTELGIADDEVLALLAATLRPEKRADAFVEAVHLAHAREPRLRGVIAGGGPELDPVRSLATSQPDIVRVLGERGDVPDLIAAADVVCLTSSFEGLPITALEAMALSRPLVATAVGGLPQAITDGRTGKLVTPGDPEAFADALVELARAPDERQAMGDAARSVYEQRYTLDIMAARYADLLAAVAATRTGGGAALRARPERE